VKDNNTFKELINKRKMTRRTIETIPVFRDGCIYYANTLAEEMAGFQKPKKIGFYNVVFWREFSGQNVVAGIRGCSGQEYAKIKRLVDARTPQRDMQRLCFDILLNELRNDVAKEWYQNKEFVLGKYNEKTDSLSVEEVLRAIPKNGIDSRCFSMAELDLFETRAQ